MLQLSAGAAKKLVAVGSNAKIRGNAGMAKESESDKLELWTNALGRFLSPDAKRGTTILPPSLLLQPNSEPRKPEKEGRSLHEAR